MINYKEGINLDSKKLDELWNIIGWRIRGNKKWQEVLSKSYFMYTAWDGDKLVGTGRIIEDGIMCIFYDISVHPEYQRKGIGQTIVEKMINKVKERSYASIGLFAWEENPANIPFYEKLGFVRKSSGMELDKFMKPE